MGVTSDRTKEMVKITQDNHTYSLFEQYGVASCSSAYKPGVVIEFPIDQPEKLLSKEDIQHFQSSRAP